MIVLFGWKNDEIVGFAAKLDRIHRAALPNAVRYTINDAAFGMKKTSILEGAKKTMTVRQLSVFKAYSAVNKATGWDINSMVSDAGIVPKSTSAKANKGSNYGKNIAKQEFGGSVDHRAYIAHKDTRTGKGLVSKNGRDVLSSKTKPIVYKKTKSKNAGDLIIRARRAYKQKTALLYINADNEGSLWQITKIAKTAKFKYKDSNQRFYFKRERIAQYEKGKSVPIKNKRKFMTTAAEIESKKMNAYFRKEAEKQISKWIKYTH